MLIELAYIWTKPRNVMLLSHKVVTRSGNSFSVNFPRSYEFGAQKNLHLTDSSKQQASFVTRLLGIPPQSSFGNSYYEYSNQNNLFPLAHYLKHESSQILCLRNR